MTIFENIQTTVETQPDGYIKITFHDSPFGPYSLTTKLNLEEAREYYNF